MANEVSPTIDDYLQREIANAFAMYVAYKRYLWNVSGPQFPELHLLFDEHAQQILETIDEFGERVRIRGGRPVAVLSAMRDTMTVLEPAHREHSVRTMLDEAIANHRRIIAELCDGVEVALWNNDPGSADLFTRVVQVHEKQEWFLRETADRDAGQGRGANAASARRT